MTQFQYFNTSTNNMQPNLTSNMLEVSNTIYPGSATLNIGELVNAIDANFSSVVRNLPSTGSFSILSVYFNYKNPVENAGSFHLSYNCDTKEFVTTFYKDTESGQETTTNSYPYEIKPNEFFSFRFYLGNGGGSLFIEDLPEIEAYSFEKPVWITSLQLISNMQSDNKAFRLDTDVTFFLENEESVTYSLAEMFPPMMTGSTNSKFLPASEPVLEPLFVTPSTSEQTFTPIAGDGFNFVQVSAVENVLPSNIKLGASILGVNGTVNEFRPTQKSITIATDATFPVTYYPEGSANGFSEFAINGITNLEASNIKKGVTIAGVAGSLEEKKLRTKYADIPSYYPLPYTINPDSNFNGMDKVIINTIGNLSASNIKAGVTIAGVQGTVVEKNAQEKTASLAATDSLPVMFNPDAGYNCFNNFAINSIENLEAANIKKDVQIAGVTGTYEGSGSSGLVTITATNHKTTDVQAGQKVLIKKEVVSGTANYYIYDVTNSVAPSYLKDYTFGVAVNAIPRNQGGSVTIPADTGTAIGRYMANTGGQGNAMFTNYSVNDIDIGADYLGYSAVGSGSFAQIALPNVPYTSTFTGLINFAFKRTGSYSESEHLVAKVTSSEDTYNLKVEEPEDIFRIYLASTSSGFIVKVAYKKTDDTFATINVDGTYMTSVGDNLFVTIQLGSSYNGFELYINGNQIGTSSYADLTTTGILRFYDVWYPSIANSCEYLLAYESGGYDNFGCHCSFSSYNGSYFLGGKYYY